MKADFASSVSKGFAVVAYFMMQKVSYWNMSSTTDQEARRVKIPTGMQAAPRRKKTRMIALGVKRGLHEPSSCCENFVYFGRRDSRL